MSTAPELRKLSLADRLKLVEDVRDSIMDEQADLPITEEQRVELDRRLDSLEAHPDRVIPWDQVKRDLRKRA